MDSIELRERILALPAGYSVVQYQSRSYGLSRTDFSAGRSLKVYAEELGGTDFISFNFYRTSSGDLLKPCEMPAEKVRAFLVGMEIT
jgi:hypothetical protein